MTQTSIKRPRIESIDLLRGVVMILMALDHVRDYFHYDAFVYNPLDPTQSSGFLFFTRFITHYCAPVFVFLAGTSAFFVGRRKSKKDLSIWLLKRGFWLIIVEVTLVKFGWFFLLDMSFIYLMVIWALGFCMIALAGLMHLPKSIGIALGILLIVGHNAFDSILFTDNSFAHTLWAMFKGGGLVDYGAFEIWYAYPLTPWIGLMLLGFHFGAWYKSDVPQEKRLRFLKVVGFGLTAGFFILRFTNLYGDPFPWTTFPTAEQTIMSFMNVWKYPPSLLYLMITMGPSFIFLAYTEDPLSSWSKKVVVIGRVPMFYYLIHIYWIHLLTSFGGMIHGWSWSDFVLNDWINDAAHLEGYGYPLWVVYLVWIFVVVTLYPICAFWNRYKDEHKDRWWLSYL